MLDSSQQEVHNVRLRAPIRIRFHYGPEDLSGVNASDLRLVWPSTANKQAKRPAQSVPLNLDPKAHTLTATVSTLYSGTTVMSATLSDANAASSEHPLVAGNTGDLNFSLPLAIPPASGGLAPDVSLTYSSASTNGRTSRGAPAPWVGDGWNLSLGSITYDAVTGLFYLNGAGGMNEQLLCCVVDSAHGNINYFMPHHHDAIHITTSDNSQHPNSTGSSFTMRTPDGTEYDFGATADSLRSTVTNGAKTYYEWDLNQVIRRASTSSGSLQSYSISYWQDLATNSGITYVRDAAPRQILYNYVNGGPEDQIWFNVHWPGATTSSGSGTATSYGTNYNCSGTPLVATTLRCDDPVTPSGYEAAPLTMTTFTLDSVVIESWNGSQWQNTRRYDFTYAADSANYTCWDDVTGAQYACSGEHLLSSVQETPYQNNSAMPSRQPITFQYTAAQKNEYHDYTVNGFDGNPFDAQTWWQYLSRFSDTQTGASSTVQWKTAWGNTHGVPSGYNDLDPFTCDSVTCSRPDDRQWMRQAATSITDVGTNTTTTYSYQLNSPCGTNCTQDTWIAPNAWNACGGVVQGPTYPNGSCLVSGPYTNYYNEDYTGFEFVTTTDAAGATDVTQYFAGDGWGSNDFQFPNAYHGFPYVEDAYAGGASGSPLQEVVHSYAESQCPPVTSSGSQLYVNGYELCDTWETQRDTYSGGTSATSGIPHKTETWTYDTTASPALGLAYNPLTADAVTSNDALADSVTTGASYGSTQPTFTTNMAYVRHDGTLDSPATSYYLANLPAQVTLDDNAGNRWTCKQISYDGQGYATGQSASLTDGLATRVDAWKNCGTSGNGYAASGVVTTGTGYDNQGQPIVTTDADALAGVAGHTGCSASATPLVAYPSNASAYSSCTSYDSAQQVYPTGSWNALFKDSTSSYDVVQGVMTASTDANGVTTSYGGPVYEYSGSPSLSTFQDLYTQATLPGETYGGSSPWSTRTFAYSFCAGATSSSTSPCLEVDTVRQYDTSDTLVTRTFYDRDGRQVETRTTSPVSGQDTVTITAYNDTNHSTWSSQPCTVNTLTTGNGGRTVTSTANYIAPTQTTSGSSAYVDPSVGGTSCSSGTLTGTTTWYDALGRTIAIDDPLGTGVGASGTGCVLTGGSVHHTTCVIYTPVVASSISGLPSTDGEPYLQAVTIDANLHQQATYTDALGRVAYTQELLGASQQAVGSGISSYAVTTSQYDPMGALRQVTDPQGHVTTFADDALGRQTALQDPNRGSESYSYDPNGNITQTVDARGASGTIYAGYDGLNRQLWRNTSNSASGAYVTYGYDSTASGNDGVGRLTSERFTGGLDNSLNGSYAYTYDTRGRQTQVVETVGSLTNCPTGWTCADVGSPTLAGTQYYSSTSVWTVQGGGADVGGTQDAFHYVYQALPGDGVVSARVATETATNTGTKVGLMMRASTDPGASFYAVFVTPGNGVEVDARDGTGATATKVVTVSGVTAPIYLQITRSGTTFSAATSSDGVTWTTVAGSSDTLASLSGSLLSGMAVNANNDAELTTATFDHVTPSTTAPAAVTHPTSVTYNDADQAVNTTYPNGDVVTTVYDAATGAMAGLNLTPKGATTATALLANVIYSGQAGAAGLMTSATLGAITGGTATYSASYDGLLRLSDERYAFTPSGGSASTLYEVQPTYDAVGNVSGVTTTLPQGVDTQAFCYDAQNRLTWAGATGTPPCSAALTPGSFSGAQYSASYSYDTLNRLTTSPLGSYSYGDGAHLDAATSIGPSGGTANWTASYDAAGNMTCHAPTSATTCSGTTPNGQLLTWDNEGRLQAWQNLWSLTGSTPATQVNLYDGEGNRVEQVTIANNVTTQHVYMGSIQDNAYQWPNAGGSTTTTKTAYYGGIALSLNGLLAYVPGDNLGSVSVRINTSGVVKATQLYGPYGAVRYQSGTSLNTDYGFTHQRSDATSGLDDYGARYYDPVAGQFTSADTTLAGGLNRYAYVGGNPETWVDPSGHVLDMPDAKPSEGFEVPSAGTPNINFGPLIGAIGATLAAFGLWIHSQFASSSAPARGSANVLARSQSNVMAAWNAYVPSPSHVVNRGVWAAHGFRTSAQDTGSSGSDLTRSVDVTSTESEAGSTPESAPQPAADGAGASQGGGGDDNCYCFWHGTNSEGAESIIQNGIDPSKLSEGVFHITEGVETARDFAAAFPITEQRLILVEWPQASYDALVQSGAIEEMPLHEGSRLTQSRLLPGAWGTYNSLAKRLFEPDLETMRWREC